MTLRLLLSCRSIRETRDFYRDTLHFEVADTRSGTLTVSLGDDRLLFTEARLWPDPPALTGTIYFGVPDVDGYFDQVKDKAALRWPLQEMSYGSREFGVSDCNGYLLAFQAATESIRHTRRKLDVEDANLEASRFSDVKLESAQFMNVNLAQSSFRDVRLSGASFDDVDLSHASITNARVDGLTINGVPVARLLGLP